MSIINWDKQASKKLNRPFAYSVDKDLFKKVNKILQEVKTRGEAKLEAVKKEKRAAE